MQANSRRQDAVLVAARFPRAIYEQLAAEARENMRSVGKEFIMLCREGLQAREAQDGQQKRAGVASR